MIGEGVNFITFTKRSIKCTFFGCQLKATFIKLKILVLIFKQGFIIDYSFSLVKAYNISLTFQYKNLYDIGNSIQNLSLQNNFKVSLQESSRYRQKSIQNIYLGVSLQNIVKDSLTKILLIQLTAFKTFSLVQNIFKDLIPERK